jgi:hypothetical protein
MRGRESALVAVCEDTGMDDLQELQLRSWAEALREAGGPERRAMGNAILMLLEEIDSLRAELQRRPLAAEEPSFAAHEVGGEATHGTDAQAETTSLDDTATIGLRDRLRSAARLR